MRETAESNTPPSAGKGSHATCSPALLAVRPMARPRKKNNTTRISISLPVALGDELDEMVAKRGYASRSEAISKMISEQLVNHQHDLGKEIMAGTHTLTTQHTNPRPPNPVRQ